MVLRSIAISTNSAISFAKTIMEKPNAAPRRHPPTSAGALALPKSPKAISKIRPDKTMMTMPTIEIAFDAFNSWVWIRFMGGWFEG